MSSCNGVSILATIAQKSEKKNIARRVQTSDQFRSEVNPGEREQILNNVNTPREKHTIHNNKRQQQPPHQRPQQNNR